MAFSGLDGRAEGPATRHAVTAGGFFRAARAERIATSCSENTQRDAPDTDRWLHAPVRS